MAVEPEPSDEMPIILTRPPRTPWLGIGLAIVLIPLASYALTEFVLIPRIKEAMREPGIQVTHPTDALSGQLAQPPAHVYEVKGIIVNVAGTMGTRYLKISFQAAGSRQGLEAAMTRNRAAILDGILGILATRTLPELEEAGARNALRHALREAINDVLGQPLVEELYFTEFVVQ